MQHQVQGLIREITAHNRLMEALVADTKRRCEAILNEQ